MDLKNNGMCKDAQAFTDLLAELYFTKRKLMELPQYMSDTVSWIGTGSNEIIQNLNEAKTALSKELMEYSGAFVIKKKWFEIVPYNDMCCVVYGSIQAEPEDTKLSTENLRFSLVLEKTSLGLKLLHLHLSNADMDQEQGHYYVNRSARHNIQDLKRTLDLRSRQLDCLNRNIPGSAHQCKNDPNFTLVSMSDSFLSMFGYSREEIETLFHNHFIEMVYPGDRAGVLSLIYEQLKKGKDIELEYRVLCKGGPPVWILDKGRLLEDDCGNETFYCLLIEITERKQAQEELRLSLERYQVIMDQATDIIFEWDIRKDTLFFSPNWYKKFGYSAIKDQISTRIPLSENIHPKDMPAFVRIMKDTAAGIPYSETEFRIRDKNRKYYWCRVRATAQFDSDGRPIKAIGVIVDIDNEKRQKQELLEMAQRDALTGLYNKAAVNSLVEQRMKGVTSSSMQALLILDVDYFKAVNDTYGHLAGDSLLSDVAAIIKSQIRSTDLAGRIGGDEFLIYMADVIDKKAVQKKAEKLLAALEELRPEPGASPISCSVGAAVFPYGHADFYTLYQCADQALYIRKNNGRRGITFYSPEAVEISMKDGLSAVGEDVGSDNIRAMEAQLAQYAFRQLYAAKDIQTTISRLLEIIGRSYDVSRVYIFEDSEDGEYCSNTFEWCADGIAPQQAKLQHLSYEEDLDNYRQNFDSDGLFYCADIGETTPNVREILKPQGIYSMLQCAILDEGRFIGYVGFDECRENRSWNPRQVAAFKLTADVLSIYLMKMRQKQKIRKLQRS